MVVSRAVRRRVASLLVGGFALLLSACSLNPAGGATGGITPGSFAGTASTVALGSSLPISLVLTDTLSSADTRGVTVNFHIARTGSFSPSTDTLLGIFDVTQTIGANSSITITPSFTYPDTGPANQNVYIYAVVTNNISTVADAAIVLAYQTPPPQTYYVTVETYPGSGSGTTYPGIAVYKDVAGLLVLQGTADITGASYGVADFTGSGLTSGTYYVLASSVGGLSGPYAIDVRSANITQQTVGDLSAGQDNTSNDNSLFENTIANIKNYNSAPPTNGVSLTVGKGLPWYMKSGDMDWFKFTLP